MLVEMLVERVFLVSGVVKTVFWRFKKKREFFVFHHEQKKVKKSSLCCCREITIFLHICSFSMPNCERRSAAQAVRAG
jgi:hypothetical protein